MFYRTVITAVMLLTLSACSQLQTEDGAVTSSPIQTELEWTELGRGVFVSCHQGRAIYESSGAAVTTSGAFVAVIPDAPECSVQSEQ